MALLAFDTINYVADARKTEDLDVSNPLKTLAFDLLVDYVGGGGITIDDAVLSGLINDIEIGGGRDTVFEADGKDLYHLLWLLNKKEPQMNVVDPVAGPHIGTMQMRFPVNLNPGQIATPKLKVKWGNAGSIGTLFTVNPATAINGSYEHVGKPLPNQKVLPLNRSATTGRDKVQLDAEGRLMGLLVITRANASPFSRRSFITDADLLIEGVVEVNDLRWEQLENEFANMVQLDGGTELGVGYLDLSDRNIIPGNQSYFRWEGDAVSSDVAVYEIFQAVLASEPIASPDLIQKPGQESPRPSAGPLVGPGSRLKATNAGL